MNNAYDSARVFRFIIALVFLANSGGCSFLKPLYKRPELPVENQYRSVGQINTAGLDAAAVGWREYFTDKKLCELIEMALKNNRDLRIAVYRVEEAQAQYGIRRADLFPTVNAGANWQGTRVPRDLSLTGQRETDKLYSVNFNTISWELDFWGRVRDLKKAALQDYLATDAARQAATISLIANVADSYLRLCELNDRIIVTRKTVTNREESLRFYTARFEGGSISKLDVEGAKALVKEAQALEVQLEQARELELNFLRYLTGSKVDIASDQGSLLNFEALSPLKAGLPAQLLENRPDIIAAEHKLMAANANIGAARAAFFPKVTLTAADGAVSARLSDLFAPESQAWTYMPQISVPIFDRGRLRSNLDLAKARTNVAVAEYEKTIQEAFREVADALASEKWLAEQAGIQQEALQAHTERLRLAKSRYDSGKVAFLEVLDAERSQLATEQNVIQAHSGLLSSRIRLYASLGGGSQTDAIRDSEIENSIKEAKKQKGDH